MSENSAPPPQFFTICFWPFYSSHPHYYPEIIIFYGSFKSSLTNTGVEIFRQFLPETQPCEDISEAISPAAWETSLNLLLTQVVGLPVSACLSVPLNNLPASRGLRLDLVQAFTSLSPVSGTQSVVVNKYCFTISLNENHPERFSPAPLSWS